MSHNIDDIDISLMETHLKILGCVFRRVEYPNLSLFLFSAWMWIIHNTEYFISLRKNGDMFVAELCKKGVPLFSIESDSLQYSIASIIINM